MKRTKIVIAWLVAGGVVLLGSPPAARGANFWPEAGGARVGYSVSNWNENFRLAEVFADWELPWRRERASGWHYESLLEASAGGLWRNGRSGLVTTLGPVVRIGRRDLPVYFNLGVSPTLISKHGYGVRNFGGAFQFTSHAGAGVNLGERWALEYRIQHMSNAKLKQPNAGLNLHAVALRFSF